MAQSQKNNDSYDTLWNKIEKLEQDRLTKSALEVVTVISEKAKKEKNTTQSVKALLYKSKYSMTLEEDAQLGVVSDFKTAIEKADFPTKNILESYLANLYWQFFQQNRHQFYNRTKTASKIDATDFRTWDLSTLFKEITIHFEASLENEKKLQEIAVSQFNAILHKQKKSEEIRPTLFDLLAHTALQFYKTSENTITRPADAFTINNAQLLCDGNTFTTLNIPLIDDTSLQARALCIYQKLLRLHLNSKKPYAYATVNIERLHFINENATFAHKDQRFLEVLQNELDVVKDNLAASLYHYEIAALLKQQGNSYNPKTNEEHRWKTKEALTICEAVIKKSPSSIGAEKCRALKSQILAQSLQLTTERYLPINTTSRLLVNYKNIDELELTAHHITEKELKTLGKLYPQDKKLTFIKKLGVAKTWKSMLKNENDYQSHSTEIMIPALGNGQYIILAAPKGAQKKAFSFSPVQVTDMALLETQTETDYHFQVINRHNGKPIPEAHLTLHYTKNYNGSRLRKNFTTDAMGSITIPLKNENWSNVSVVVNYAEDTAYFEGFHINKKYVQTPENDSYTCFLFTDRGIYRPGQTVYFKGIAIKKNTTISSVLVHTPITVQFKDVNGQVLTTQEFTTNDYGSFAGEYILPNNGLTGIFSMHVLAKKTPINGYTNFSVEEYKRPKFETTFNPITESYKVNDIVTLSGKAIAYAGSNITDAKVSYRVKRVVSYPRWYYWYNPQYRSTPQEITFGETTTDADGNYTINFKALPDVSAIKQNNPTFTYEVTADVTDINGETHSATSTVTIGYHTLTATIESDNPIDKNATQNSLTITTKNLNGQFVAAKGVIKIYKLKAPDQVLRPRTWLAPDYAGFSEAKFRELYPHDAFNSEHDPSTWEKETLVWQGDFNTEKSKKIKLGNTKNWPSGKYSIELVTQDKFGQEVKDLLHTDIIGSNDKKIADNQLFEIKPDKSTYAIGDVVNVTVLSAAKDMNVTVYVEKNHKIVATHLIHLNDNTKHFSVPVNANDLGGFAISYSYAAFNSFKSGSLNIKVPYPKTDLDIETLIFRDKVQPGTEETWSFKIKGPKGEKVTAELLASMYDASLDTFKEHEWVFNPLTKATYYPSIRTNARASFHTNRFYTYLKNKRYSYSNQQFDTFHWFGLHFGYDRMLYATITKRRNGAVSYYAESIEENEMAISDADDKVDYGYENLASPAIAEQNLFKLEEQSLVEKKTQDASKDIFEGIKIRKNLQETAFFFPQLHTDKQGNVSFSFTTPEALTKWNLQLLAHTKSLESTVTNMQTVTQKELMIIPNAPRFLREGDVIYISSKIANLSDKKLTGSAQLQLMDAVTGKNITKALLQENKTTEATMHFTVDALGNTQVSWRLSIPQELQAVEYKVVAKAGDFSDGEQNLLPVLSNRMLVTETLPMWVRSNQTKTFTLDKLKNTTSTTLKHHKLTLEMTSNPAWYAVQALPYLMEYPYECNEQTFSKYYANTLATHIASSNPNIQEVFKQWANADVLMSNLEKNQELKSLLIQETPWLRDAQSETEQKKRIALLFNLNTMKNKQAIALNKLKQNQKSSGAWSWFNGGPDNRYITQHIIAGLGHLKQLHVVTKTDNEQRNMITKALHYLDNEFIKEYQEMKKHAANLNDDHLSQMQIHYLYMRSFFGDIATSNQVKKISSYYIKQGQKYWTKKGLYAQGMLALTMYRMQDEKTAHKILRALKENSITSAELGMYWKENTSSWYWYQAPIETQALLIEAFSEIHPTAIETIDNLKIWLLKNKQTNQWKTTKATTEAVYALLLQGSDWLSITEAVDVLIGGKKIAPSKLENVRTEAGTGYYKTTWNGEAIEPKMAEVQISKKGAGIAWGALYWQYFEDLDKITAAETPLKLNKKLFLKKNTTTGETLYEINPKTTLNIGDLVRVRIELRADRQMEFVHMKDMRAAGFEPINVISRYKWQDGLGYYEATKDASTNFFFDYLPKGVYVFEYDLRVNNAGTFSNGITTIQSMYAPEFSSHSTGLRVKVN